MDHRNGSAPVRLLEETLGEKPPRLPCIRPGGMMNMITAKLMERCGISWPKAHSDPKAMPELVGAVFSNGPFDNIGMPFCMTVE